MLGGLHELEEALEVVLHHVLFLVHRHLLLRLYLGFTGYDKHGLDHDWAFFDFIV